MGTNQRKLQLTQAFSVANLDPVGLAQFRSSGELTLGMPLEAWGPPGTYLATIRQVRLSIAALVPPVQGVRGTLTGGNASHIVVPDGSGGFRAETLLRAPETVVITSPLGASGVFTVDLNSELLLPWEGCGLDLPLHLSLPPAVNAFDYHTIADVQLSIDYTALYSPSYAAQVIPTLPTATSGVVTYSLRDEADSWYQFLSQAQADPAPELLSASWLVAGTDFPANAIPPISVDAISVYFVRHGTTPPAFTADHLRRNGVPTDPPTPTNTASVGDVISTRNGSGEPWQPLCSGDPTGTWELGLVADAGTLDAVSSGDLQDIVLALTFHASLPPWIP
jgi:hypothetical protein